MTKKTTYTDLQLDIVKYVKENGAKDVPVSAAIMNQNKNFYERVRILEHNGLITVKRFDGYASQLTITELGREVIKCCNIKEEFPGIVSSLMEEESDEQFLKSLVRSSTISESLKNKICLLLS